MVRKLLEFIKWMFPLRYRLYQRVCRDETMPRGEWEKFIRDYNYTAWLEMRLSIKWWFKDSLARVKRLFHG